MTTKNITYLFYVIIIVFVLSELGLRMLGYNPNNYQSYQNFHTVDSIFVYNNYSTDEDGIYTFSPFITDSVRIHESLFTAIDSLENQNQPSFTKSIDWSIDRIADVISEFKNLPSRAELENEQNEFLNFAHELVEKDTLSPVDSIILGYINHPFNKEGFRSISFKPVTSNQKKILLLGDSFTYGLSAEPIYASFADILLARGNIVYNTGISGSDPAQYLAICNKYVEELKPDIVIINFCLNNDFMNYLRIPVADKPLEFVTNAGLYFSSPEGKFLHAAEAYEYYQQLNKIPQTSFFNKLMSLTATTSQIWGKLNKWNFVKHEQMDNYSQWRFPSNEDLIKHTTFYIDGIFAKANSLNIPVQFVLIPDVGIQNEEGCVVLPEEFDLSQWEKYNYIFPIKFTSDDFAKDPDLHFNNRGALKYANILDSLILKTKPLK